MKFSTNWHFNNTVCELIPKKIEDKRGFFSEVYHQHSFEEIGIKDQFIQENYSYSKKEITFRGLPFQNNRFEQGKGISVIIGRKLYCEL